MFSVGAAQAGVLQALLVLCLLGTAYVPFGNYMAKTYTATRHWRIETLIYRLCGVDPDQDQTWVHYLRSLLAFSAIGVLALYGLLRTQALFPFSQGHQGVPAALAFNTAISFTTNTSWQNYAGEATLGHLALAVGLGVEAFASAAVGMAGGVALVRGLARRQTDRIGNFWVDLVRGSIRILLPLSAIFAVVLVALGVVQNLHGPQAVTTVAGGSQTLLGGPVGSWEPIKLLSGDGGGAFNANSAHPFENPNPVTNVLEIVMMLLIPVCFIRLFGRMVGSHRQGWALLAVAGMLFAGGAVATTAAEHAHHDVASIAAGAATEGTETRFGIPSSALFGATATATADGAADAGYDSFSSLGGGVLMANILLGEVSPGGAGSGLYGLLMIALLAVFLAGLLVGRTPEFLGKQLRAAEMRLIALYTLTAPVIILAAAGVAAALPVGRRAPGNPGPHGFSEILYAFTSSTNSNG
ncbi:MAG TPA: potassium-transporting ATPase subunit KdpA, partial [Kineosporiaceae bacterium]|nr:potassium-transporting ATPase subunit KdpA [Kineosporiaceae bacterium]